MRTIAAWSILLLASQANAMSIVMPDPTMDQTQAALVFGSDTIGPDPDGHPWSFSVEYGDTFVGQKGSYLNEAAIAVANGTMIVGFNNTGLNTNNVGFAVSADNGVTWRPEYNPVTVRNPYADSMIYSSDPGVAVCKTSRGKTKMLVSWVAFGTDFLDADTFGEHFNCAANNVFAITGTTDNGIRWDVVHPVAIGPGVFRDRPMIACDPASTRCWAMFNGYPEEPITHYCDEEGSQVYVATSNNCGSTWSAPVLVGSGHMAPTNLAVLRNGKVRFAMFTNQYTMNIYECSTSQVCTVLATSGMDYLSVYTDHAHVQGLLKTRLNSMPVIACEPYGTKCTVAYMAERGSYMGNTYRASIVYRTSVDNGVTWTPSALAPQLNANQPDQVLPMISWGPTKPGLCWYQRQALYTNAADHTFKILCSNSNDGGLTWNPPVDVGAAPVILSTANTLGVQSFLGDYNMLDSMGGWMAITNILAAGVSGGVSTKPVIEVIPYSPEGGCQVDPNMAFSWWSLLLPFMLLFRVWVTPASAACMGDCNGDNEVKVNELIENVLILLEEKNPNDCLNPVDLCEGEVAVVCMVQAVNNGLEGCKEE